jgi:hypothetical protein
VTHVKKFGLALRSAGHFALAAAALSAMLVAEESVIVPPVPNSPDSDSSVSHDGAGRNTPTNDGSGQTPQGLQQDTSPQQDPARPSKEGSTDMSGSLNPTKPSDQVQPATFTPQPDSDKPSAVPDKQQVRHPPGESPRGTGPFHPLLPHVLSAFALLISIVSLAVAFRSKFEMKKFLALARGTSIPETESEGAKCESPVPPKPVKLSADAIAQLLVVRDDVPQLIGPDFQKMIVGALAANRPWSSDWNRQAREGLCELLVDGGPNSVESMAAFFLGFLGPAAAAYDSDDVSWTWLSETLSSCCPGAWSVQCDGRGDLVGKPLIAVACEISRVIGDGKVVTKVLVPNLSVCHPRHDTRYSAAVISTDQV